VLIAPFHNMMLVSPATSDADADRLVAATAETLRRLMGIDRRVSAQ
jgi:glutamate-1-semialdehyde 2,1-aminomutase